LATSGWSGWRNIPGSTPSAPTSTIRDYRLLRNATLFDDFENYAVGEFPSAGGWEIADFGGTYIAEVSRDYSYSSPQAFKLRNVAVHRKVFDDIGEMWRYVRFEASVMVTEVYIGGAHYDLCLTPSDPYKSPSVCVRLTVNDKNGDGEYDICPGWGKYV